MTGKLTEQLSALMDNECTEHEFSLALRRLGKENGMLASWERYHLISDILKGHTPDVVTTGFSVRVADMIELEPTHRPADTPRARNQVRPSWFRPVAGVAIAASVAGVAMFVLPTNTSEQADITAVSSLSSTNLHLAVTSDPRSEQDKAMAEKLNAYLANHNELATLNGIQGVMPYVKIVNYHASR